MNPVYIPAAVTFAIACVLLFLLARKHRQVQKLRQKIVDLRHHIDYLSLLTEGFAPQRLCNAKEDIKALHAGRMRCGSCIHLESQFFPRIR